MGLSRIEFVELTSHVAIPVLERLPNDKTWLIPMCIIRNDRLCKMRFMFENLDDFVEMSHNSTMDEIREVFMQSTIAVDPWMGLLMEDSGLSSMDAIMYKDWNMEQPVIALSGQTIRRRAESYLMAVATSNSIKILYAYTMVGPVSILKMDKSSESNSHDHLTRVWQEFSKSQSRAFSGCRNGRFLTISSSEASGTMAA